MSRLKLDDVHKRFGDVEVIRGIDLDVGDGEFCAFVGPSGCGKSTLLRMIAGLEEMSEGTITIGERDVTDEEPSHRGVAMVFQSYALYPHMTVAQNMGFSLKLARIPKQQIDAKVAKAAEILQLTHLLERWPRNLSGGQRQRVAIGRAIVREPEVFLFDEPLSNLDAALRVGMRVELAKLKAELRSTIIYVTHDQVEAMTLADRIVVINDGRVEQVGAPMELYGRPVNRFVAGFIGSPRMNFLTARLESIREGSAHVVCGGTARVAIPVAGALDRSATMTLGVRPEHLVLDERDENAITGRVEVVELLGGEAYCHMRTADDEVIVVKAPGDTRLRAGHTVQVGLKAAMCHLFDDTGVVVSTASHAVH